MALQKGETMDQVACELCTIDLPPEDYFSLSDCNDTGTGVVLCEQCSETLEPMEPQLRQKILKMSWALAKISCEFAEIVKALAAK